MEISWSSISAGAMTAAISIGSSAQALGAGAGAAASQALPTVTSSGLQAVSHGATAAASALPSAVGGGLPAASAQLARDIAVVEKPAKAMAAAVPGSSLALRTAATLSRVLPLVTIGASALAGARIVEEQGAAALLTTREGRGSVLGAAGGTLLLVPHPAAQLAAAGALGAVAANHFGGLDRLGHARLPG